MINTILIPILVLAITIALSWPLGRYMKWAMAPSDPGPRRRSYERAARGLFGGFLDEGQNWKQYIISLLAFNAVMWLFVFTVIGLQHYLPLNPDGKGALTPDLLYNTVSSFTSNTNLQHYSGEVSMSYLSQLFGLMWLQFVSAATGIAALAALCRGLAGKVKMGNFFTDLHRATFLVLLPLAFLGAVLLMLGGMPMTFKGAAVASTLEGVTQTIARGPAAAFVSIKQLGTNGGGFFGPNSTHPFENPIYWTNILENIYILLIPMGCVWMFGRITRRMKHATVIFGVMLVLFVTLVGVANWAETQQPTAALTQLPVEQSHGNLEGKEMRLGDAWSGSTWAVSTTSTSNGSVGNMNDSMNPLAGLMPMIGMWLNSIFGGVGVGFINMFLYVVVAVFIAGLMVGRTPEYLTKKVESKEMKLALIPLLLHPFMIIGGTALFAVTPWGLEAIQDVGSHGLSEIIYEFSSASANNGSGFEGLGDNTLMWNTFTGTIMLLMRYIPIITPLAIAGLLAGKKESPVTSGTLRTNTVTFGLILIAVLVIIGALLFLPVAVLAPIAEHLGAGVG